MKAKMRKLSLSVKPLLVIVFLCCMQTVSAFNYMTGNYTVTVQSKGTGAGKVYSTSSWFMWDNKDPNNTSQQHSGNSNKEVELLPTGTSTTLDMTTGSKSVNGWDNPSVRFSNVTLTADNYPGSTFDGWEASYGTVEGETLKLPIGEQITTQQGQSNTPELNSNKDVIIYAIFTAKTYHFISPSIRAVYQGESGIETGGGTVALVPNNGNPSRPADGSGDWQTQITGSLISAQGNGVDDGIVYEYAYYAKPNDGYVFLGWHTLNGTTLTKLSGEQDYLPAEGTTATSTDVNNPTQGPVMVALFKKSTTYWHTGVSVAIAGYEDERAEKGWVFADDGTLGTVEAVESAGKWVKSLHDETAYPEVDQTEYKYTYYAKVSDPAKYAFKGWARTPFGVVDYEDIVLEDLPFTMTDDNTSEINAYPTPTLYAVFESFFFRCPPVAVADNSRGGGKVHVSLAPASIENCTKEEISAGADLQQVAATGTSHKYTVYYYAKKVDGAEFVGWSTTADGLNILPNSIGKAEYSTTYESQNKSKNAPHVAAPLYAVFRHDFDIRQQDRMIVYDDEDGNKSINDAKVLIDFQKGNTLTATLSGADASYFTLSNRSGSKKGSTITFDATQGLIEMVVAYQGDLAEAVGKKAEITLSAIYGSYTDSVKRNVTIIVEEAPMITFLPTDGKGSYTIKMTNGSGINYTMSAAAKENINVQVTHESMSNLEMNITDLGGDEYRFFGWQMIDGATTTYISYDDLVNYQFTKSVKVRPEFIHNSRATYSIIGDDTNTPYHDFAQVMKDAGELAESMQVSQTVLLNDSWKGETITEGVLPKGNYTIPKGVNLLIPGDTAHTYRTNLTRDAGDFINKDKMTSSEHIRWIVEEGTNITVQENANILVYSRIITYGNNDNGRPYQYGHIELKENCKLNFLSGSNLYVYGYITGPLTSEITMNSGTTVKEVFQLKDWRGGTATSQIVFFGGRYNVFLIGQYYVQNIEVPLVLKKGASEILEAGISDLADMDVDFIVSNTGAGLFRMGEGTWVKKYYDPYTDRICFIGSKDEGATGEMQVNYVSIDAGIATVSSADYVLPIPSNFDIKIQGNLTGTLLNDFAFMPGSTLTVEKGSTLKVNKRLFAYDDIYKTIDGKGYYGAGNAVFAPLSYRPGNFKYTRSTADLVDAKFVIDGELICNGGEIYTTNATNQNTNHANITSNGGGKVTFGSLSGYDTKVYQIYQDGTSPSYKEVPVSPARLRHGNGSYETNPEQGTYTYVNNKWTKDAATTPNPTIPAVVDYIPRFTVSEVPEASTYVGKSTTITVSASANNTNIPNEDWANPTKMEWDYKLIGTDANQFSLSGNQGAGTITFEPKSEGRKTVTLRITATYTRNVNSANTTVKYTYSRDVQLVGNATYLAANTLAFADLSTLYKGQTNVALFSTGNNTNPITITADPASRVTITGNTAAATIAGNTIGEVTLTATQEADLTNNIAATTITKTIEVNDPVQWNWDVLYLGELYDTPITMLDGSEGWTLTEQEDKYNIIDLKGTAPNYTASVANLIAGSFKIDFTFTQNGQDRTFTSHVIVDPRHLRVDVNSDTIFRAVTLSANEAVNFREGQNGGDGQIVFSSTESSISQWKLGFFGVPDKIYFQPNGTNAWQIEESPNGVNWTTSFPWKYIDANIDFELSLLPTTRFLRISYGAGSTTPASLKELYITELSDVKTDVEKLYIPVQKDANGSVIPYTKEVVFTYANTGKLRIGTTNPTFFKLKESTSTGATGDVVNIDATSEKNPFGVTGIEVVSTADKEMESYLEVYEDNTLVLQIPIQTYLFPQELPIKLATDKPDGGDRYYYVTTHTHNAEWDGRDNVRTITLNNAVSDAAPYVTFEYKGNPTYIGFNHSTTAKGTWELEQFINGNWAFVPHTPTNGDVMDPVTGTFKRFVNPQASKLRVIYQSEYAEKVNITDLVIVGDASAIVDPARMELDYNVPEDLNVTAINLPNLKITSTNTNFTVAYNNGTLSSYETTHELSSTQFPILNGSDMGNIPFKVKWLGTNAIEHGTLELTATIDGDEKLLATVELVGMKADITDGDLGIYTGVAAGYTLAGKYNADGVTLSGRWQGDTRRPVNIDAAFDPNDNALFDYVVVYGETTTSDGSKTINLPNSLIGSNAKTPCYIYKKNGDSYQFYKSVENANSKEKTWNETSQEDMDAVQIPNGQTAVSMYITGFCPYASTGYTKADEGVWYFRANAGQSINVYLQDCYIYSRAKTHDGHTFVDRQDGNSFSSRYTCGSGAVLVFACNDNDESVSNPMNVTIHTLDSSLLKSNYGCFLQSAAGRAFQVSPAIQIRLINDQYYQTTTTVLNFTDEWLASQHTKTGVGKRTNGFLSLQKQHNNAPSIDMGNARTVVNFNGGQVELQNAQIVSTNYISSMAICHRTGEFAGIFLAYGMGTDGVGGTVNFIDGTTTVQTMEVAANYRQYYLMDVDANGNELTTTSCLRTPQNTFVKGGSHCMMRACSSPTSKGGAPKDKAGNDGKLLGLYKFPKNPDAGKKGGWTEGENGLVNVVTADEDPQNHQVPVGYNVKSITPNNNGTKDNKEDDFLNFWFDPDFEPSAKPEIDVPSSFWKTCMTRIAAQYGGEGGSAGGAPKIGMQNGNQHEEIVNLMYCKIDEYIHNEIRKETFAAPVKNPGYVGEAYLPVKPSYVSDTLDFYIDHQTSFQVERKVYYITTATADVWNAFTAPFDVENIYIMETYPEQLLKDMEGTKVDGNALNRKDIIQAQAKHNADFAAFFAVTVALGQQKDFETIYREYIDWAKIQDKASGAWDGKSPYTLRGKSALVPYDGENWDKADFYLNENNGVWQYTGEEGKEFKTEWVFADASDGKLMHKGRTYSMLLPFCTKCGDDIDDREFWDYWSGKFLIFESTDGPHIVDGTAAINEVVDADPTEFAPNSYDAKLTGNHTFNAVNTAETYIWNYVGDLQHSTFRYNKYGVNVNPTESFLIANVPSKNGMPARGVTTSGQIIYDNNGDGTMTGGNIPTVGGGNDLFITSTVEGINIAVAEPQHVRVLSSTGAVLYSGMVQTAVDVALPTTGVYVITGENEVHKILH